MNYSYYNEQQGQYGQYGGRYIPEILTQAVSDLKTAFLKYRNDEGFSETLHELLSQFAGRPTPLTEIKEFAEGPKLFLKREDLLHTGAHKINNVLGQCLLAQMMGKTRIIAETGAGQHGVATATACAHLGLECVIYMGAKDMKRQQINAEKMKLLGATVVAAQSGAQTLKSAVNEAMRDWAASYDNTHYCLGSVLGPDPFPELVAYFHSVIGQEAKRQCKAQAGQLPNEVIACIGGGSNAIGIFQAFLNDPVRLVGVEAGGRSNQDGQHAARFINPKKGVLHGCYSYVVQNHQGQIGETESIAAGLDYPMIGPFHADLADQGRVEYTNINNEQAVHAFKRLSRTEGIIPALESSHALAGFLERLNTYASSDVVVINLSGRGDKDLAQLISQGYLS